MKWSRSVLIATLLAAATSGCQGTKWPTIFPSGTAKQQQQQAQKFDPYPQDENGPAIVGGRPINYDKPPVESTRARWPQWGFPKFGFK